MDLIKKARIVLPDSALLIGVVDENGILEEDEIFVQIKRDNFATSSNYYKSSEYQEFIDRADSIP
jgi:hypothetical protein